MKIELENMKSGVRNRPTRALTLGVTCARRYAQSRCGCHSLVKSAYATPCAVAEKRSLKRAVTCSPTFESNVKLPLESIVSGWPA